MDYVIMNITTGELVGKVFEEVEDATMWIEEQDIPEIYQIIERD